MFVKSCVGGKKINDKAIPFAPSHSHAERVGQKKSTGKNCVYSAFRIQSCHKAKVSQVWNGIFDFRFSS